MSEDPTRSVIPPRPPLPPKALRKRRARQARLQERLARAQEKQRLQQERHRLRRSKDVALYHGHYVVSGDDLGQVFTGEERLEDPIQFRHRIIHGVTLTVLSALVIAGIVLAVMISNGTIRLHAPAGKSAPTPSCPGATFNYPANKDIHLEVYNSTRREGLAGSVAAQLKGRGFNVDTIANKSTDYEGTAVVVSGPAGESAAFSVQRNIAGTEYVQDARTDATVDVYLTGAFQDLVPAAQVDQKPGQLSCPRFSPSPTPGGPSGGAPGGPTTAAPAP
jgi:hypothetical protein